MSRPCHSPEQGIDGSAYAARGHAMSGGKSERLRLSEVRAAFRLVGECRDLGADHAAWRGHLAARLGGLTGGQVGMVFESATPADVTIPGRVFAVVAVGWPSARARDLWASY